MIVSKNNICIVGRFTSGTRYDKENDKNISMKMKQPQKETRKIFLSSVTRMKVIMMMNQKHTVKENS